MASSFSRQLKFALALVDSFARLTAEALLSGNYDYAKHLAGVYAKAQKFRASSVWYEWKCSSYEIFVKNFYKWCEKEGA